ncbi:hypothetical protein BRD00_06505 [Halobacteriales archaeon QS_8_69_26]|nr:MAG: hypothetical protein BRD00_06505 [Halobacteriales archaeon QS_8_69_26]
MDRVSRGVVVLAVVVGLAAVAPTAGIVVDAGDEGPESVAGTTPETQGDGDASVSPAGRESSTVDERAPVRPRSTTNRTPHRLGVGPGPVRSGFATPGPDLGASLSVDHGEFGGAYILYLARERLEAAETDAERRDVIRELIERTRGRVEALRDREETAIRAYHNGSIDRQELLRRLARVDAEAGALRESVADLRESYPSVILPFESRLLNLIRGLQSMEGPIRDRIGQSVQGQATTGRIHVEASGEGLVLELIDGELYVREAIRMDHYAPDEPPSDIYSGIFERLNELYPQIPAESATTRIDSVGSRLFEITKSHSMGGLTLYLDRTTGEVYRETQRLRLDRIPTTKATSATGDELLLAVNRTPDGNPYRISVVDVATGDPVDATVSVDGREVGRTGVDGVLWTLGPRGAFNVSAATERERINVTVSD